MSIHIIKPGMLATLQDAGRKGFRSIGVGSGGVMDSFAMEAANYLCGNDEKEAVLEINFPAPEITFEQDAIVGLAGADFNAVVNEAGFPPWRTFFVKKNSVLKFKEPLYGSKAYLAVSRGWNSGKWLNSYSTHLKLKMAGHFGRALQKDDRVSFPAVRLTFETDKMLAWQISRHELDKIYMPSNALRCIRGPEYALLDEASQQNFNRQVFIITPRTDRMGYRLDNASLSLKKPMEMISSPVDTGTVQLLPNGHSIILAADHQTTGGYPRVASVIKADLPRLAQVKPGEALRFTLVSLEYAEDKLLQMRKTLEEIKAACFSNLKKYVHLDRY